MKKKIYFLIAIVVVFACNEIRIEVEDLTPENTKFESLRVTNGFNFISASKESIIVELGDGFELETVTIQLFYKNSNNEILVHQGFSSVKNPFQRNFMLANHYHQVRIKATYQGLETFVDLDKNQIGRVILNKTDFSAIDIPRSQANQPSQAQAEQDFVYSASNYPNGDVQIASRVLIILGSHYDDELNVDRNGSGTKVILRTNGNIIVNTQYNNSDFDCIFVHLRNGKDIVQMGSTEKPSLINLGNGQDEIIASDQVKDIIYGGGGDDKIVGKYATDELIGGDGNDYIDNSNGGTIEQDGPEKNLTSICGSIDADGDGVNEGC